MNPPRVSSFPPEHDVYRAARASTASLGPGPAWLAAPAAGGMLQGGQPLRISRVADRPATPERAQSANRDANLAGRTLAGPSLAAPSSPAPSLLAAPRTATGRRAAGPQGGMQGVI